MACYPAPASVKALTQASELWPSRSRASDGICASKLHNLMSPTSDHAIGNAFDLTYDPANGCDAHALVEQLRLTHDPRVKYIISNRRIAGPGSRGGSWEWKTYFGINPHTHHAHVSILPSFRNNTNKWWNLSASPIPTPTTPTTPEEEPMIVVMKDHYPVPKGPNKGKYPRYVIHPDGTVDNQFIFADTQTIKGPTNLAAPIIGAIEHPRAPGHLLLFAADGGQFDLKPGKG